MRKSAGLWFPCATVRRVHRAVNGQGWKFFEGDFQPVSVLCRTLAENQPTSKSKTIEFSEKCRVGCILSGNYTAMLIFDYENAPKCVKMHIMEVSLEMCFWCFREIGTTVKHRRRGWITLTKHADHASPYSYSRNNSKSNINNPKLQETEWLLTHK